VSQRCHVSAKISSEIALMSARVQSRTRIVQTNNIAAISEYGVDAQGNSKSETSDLK
jgi:hypothetical protein